MKRNKRSFPIPADKFYRNGVLCAETTKREFWLHPTKGWRSRRKPPL